MEYPIQIDVNGLTLRGVAHQLGQERQPVVILFHGFTGNKAEDKFLFVRFARELASKGIGCVRFDFSGSGESDGAFCDMTFGKELEEAKAILEYVKSLDWVDVSKIMVGGFSMGGAIATQIAKDQPDAIAKLCLWAPSGEMNQAAVHHYKSRPKLANGNVDFDGLELGHSFYEDLKDRDLYVGIEAYKNPVIILHGTEDQAVPREYVEKYFEIYQDNPAEIVWIEGANHVFSNLNWRKELIEKSVAFLKK